MHLLVQTRTVTGGDIMQGSKTIERAARTRSKNPERVERALATKATRKGADRLLSQERKVREASYV